MESLIKEKIDLRYTTSNVYLIVLSISYNPFPSILSNPFHSHPYPLRLGKIQINTIFISLLYYICIIMILNHFLFLIY